MDRPSWGVVCNNDTNNINGSISERPISYLLLNIINDAVSRNAGYNALRIVFTVLLVVEKTYVWINVDNSPQGHAQQFRLVFTRTCQLSKRPTFEQHISQMTYLNVGSASYMFIEAIDNDGYGRTQFRDVDVHSKILGVGGVKIINPPLSNLVICLNRESTQSIFSH